MGSSDENNGPFYEIPLAHFAPIGQDDTVPVYDVPWPDEFPLDTPSSASATRAGDGDEHDITISGPRNSHYHMFESPVRSHLYEHGGIESLTRKDIKLKHKNGEEIPMQSYIAWRAWHNEIELMEVPEAADIRQNRIILRFPVDMLAKSVYVRMEAHQGNSFLIVSVATVVATVHHFGFAVPSPEEKPQDLKEEIVSIFTPYADQDTERPLDPYSTCVLYSGVLLSSSSTDSLGSSMFSWRTRRQPVERKITSAVFQENYAIIGFEDGELHLLHSDGHQPLYGVKNESLRQTRFHTSKSMLQRVLSAFSTPEEDTNQRAVLDCKIVYDNTWIITIHQDASILLWRLDSMRCQHAWDLADLTDTDIDEDDRALSAELIVYDSGAQRESFTLRVTHGPLDARHKGQLEDSHFFLILDHKNGSPVMSGSQLQCEENEGSNEGDIIPRVSVASDKLYMKHLTAVDAVDTTNTRQYWQCWNEEDKPGILARATLDDKGQMCIREAPLSWHYRILDMLQSEMSSVLKVAYSTEEWLINRATEAADKAKRNYDMIFDVTYSYSTSDITREWEDGLIKNHSPGVFGCISPMSVQDLGSSQGTTSRSPHEDAQEAVLRAVGSIDSHCLRILCGNDGYLPHGFLESEMRDSTYTSLIATVVDTRLENNLGDIDLPAIFEDMVHSTLFEFVADATSSNVDSLHAEELTSACALNAFLDFPKAYLLYCIIITIQQLASYRPDDVRKAAGFIPIQAVENARQFFSLHVKAWQYFFKQFYKAVEQSLQPLALVSSGTKAFRFGSPDGVLVLRRQGLYALVHSGIRQFCSPERYLRSQVSQTYASIEETIGADPIFMCVWASSAVFSLLPLEEQYNLLYGNGSDVPFCTRVASISDDYDSLVASAASTASHTQGTENKDRKSYTADEASSIVDILWEDGTIAPSAESNWDFKTILKLTALPWSSLSTMSDQFRDCFTQLESFAELVDLCYNRQSMFIAENLVARRSGESRGLHGSTSASRQPSFLLNLLGHKARAYCISALLAVQRCIISLTENSSQQSLMQTLSHAIKCSGGSVSPTASDFVLLNKNSAQYCDYLSNSFAAFGSDIATTKVKLSLLYSLMEKGSWFCRKPMSGQREGEGSLFSMNPSDEQPRLGLKTIPTDLERKSLNPRIYYTEDNIESCSEAFNESMRSLSSAEGGLTELKRNAWCWLNVMKLTGLRLDLSTNCQKDSLLRNLNYWNKLDGQLPWKILSTLGLQEWINHECALFASFGSRFHVAYSSESGQYLVHGLIDGVTHTSKCPSSQETVTECFGATEIIELEENESLVNIYHIFPLLSRDLLDSTVLQNRRVASIRCVSEDGLFRLDRRQCLLNNFVKLFSFKRDMFQTNSFLQDMHKYVNYLQQDFTERQDHDTLSVIPYWERVPCMAYVCALTGQYFACAELFQNFADVEHFFLDNETSRQIKMLVCVHDLHASHSFYQSSQAQESNRLIRRAVSLLNESCPNYLHEGIRLTCFSLAGASVFCIMASALLRQYRRQVNCIHSGNDSSYWPSECHSYPLEFTRLAIKHLSRLSRMNLDNMDDNRALKAEVFDVKLKATLIEIEELQWLQRYSDALTACRDIVIPHYRRNAVQRLAIDLASRDRWDVISSLPYDLESTVWTVEHLTRETSYKFFSKIELKDVGEEDLKGLKQAFMNVYALMVRFSLVGESRHVLWRYCSLLSSAHETLAQHESPWNAQEVEIALLNRVLLLEGLGLLLALMEECDDTEQWVCSDPSAQTESLAMIMTMKANTNQVNFDDPISSAADVFTMGKASYVDSNLRDTSRFPRSSNNDGKSVRTKFDLLSIYTVVSNELAALQVHKLAADYGGLSEQSMLTLRSICNAMWSSSQSEDNVNFIPLQEVLIRQGQYFRALQLAQLSAIIHLRRDKILRDEDNSHHCILEETLYQSFHAYGHTLSFQALTNKEIVERLASTCARIHGSYWRDGKETYDIITLRGLNLDLGYFRTKRSSATTFGVLWDKLHHILELLTSRNTEYPGLYETAIESILRIEPRVGIPSWLLQNAEAYVFSKGDPSSLLQILLRYGERDHALNLSLKLVSRSERHLSEAIQKERYDAPDYLPLWLLMKLVSESSSINEDDSHHQQQVDRLTQGLNRYASLLLSAEVLSDHLHQFQPPSATGPESDSSFADSRISASVRARDLDRQERLVAATRDVYDDVAEEDNVYEDNDDSRMDIDTNLD